MGGRMWNGAASVAAVVLGLGVVGPVWAQPASGATEAGDSKVSPAVLQLRRSYLDPSVSTLTFRSMDRIYQHRPVPRGGPVWAIPRDDHALDFTYTFEGKTYTPEAFLDRTFTNALIVIKDGKIVYETYRNNATAQDRFIGFSMTKSVTSILVGAALAEGKIKSLDDPITAYLPELKTGGYNDVTIRQILQMRSGVYRNETYEPKDLNSQPPGSPMASLRDEVVRYVDAAPTVERRDQPGSTFRYMNLDTAVLGLLIERVTGGSIAGYASRRLWEPMGAEADAFFIMDGPPGVGREFNVAGLNATLRDWARVGLTMLNQGKANGTQVIAADWVAASVKPVPTGEPSGQGYGYQWWIEPDNSAYLMQGHMGQFVYVNPTTKTVIVKLSYFPPNASAAGRESHAFFAAASTWTPR